MTRERLMELLERFSGLRIVVAGDLFLDRYWMIDPRLDEPSLETDLAARQVTGTRLSAGAAGTVLNNLSAMGIGTLGCVSLLGDDGEAEDLRTLLTRRRVDMSRTCTSTLIATPFYTKPMFLIADGSYREGSRIDRKNRCVMPEELEEKMVSHTRDAAKEADAVIFLDQLTDENTGVVTSRMRLEAARLAEENPGLVLFADSRSFIDRFTGISIKCNFLEAAALTEEPLDKGFRKEAAFRSLGLLQKKTPRPVFVTCQEHGIAVIKDGQPVLAPAARQEGPIDVVGAGDACTAGIVSALCAGADPLEAAQMGNLCAGVTVRKLGTTGTANREEILNLYDEQFSQAR